MKIFIPVILIAGLGLILSGFQKPAVRPNIILILADDLGYGELGCYGQDKIKTPNLDRLARSGMRFTQYYSGNTVCAPSRCALLTGKHTGHSDIRDNYEMGGFPDQEERGQLPMKPDQFTMAHMLKNQGYRTAVVGKWGLGMPTNEGSPKNAGFDFFYGYACQKQAHNYYPSHLWKNDQWDTLRNGYFSPHQKFEGTAEMLNAELIKQHYTRTDYAPDMMRKEALGFIKNNKQPYFLYYAIPMPHLGLQIPVEELEQYKDLPDTPYTGNRQYLPHHRPRAAYAAMVSRLDQEVGIILDEVRKSGQEKNTLILFMSDNGATIPGIGGADTRFFKSNSNLRGYKTELYEGAIRVPCLASWPGKIKPGTVNHSVIAAWDWLPTLSKITASSVRSDLDGISLTPALLKNKLLSPDRYLYWEYASAGGIRALRKGDWKLLWLTKTKEGQLYNLKNDIGETKNVISEQTEITNQLLALMKSAHTPSRIPAWNKYE